MRMEVPFREWLPDLPDYKNPGLETAENVVAVPDGFQPLPAGQLTDLQVTGTIQGAARFYRRTGTRVIVVGTNTDLYVIVSDAVNASSLSLSVGAGVIWQFEQYGVKLYAVAKDVGYFVLDDIESDTTFAAVTGTQPNGSSVARVGDFMMMGDLTDIDTSTQPYRVRWSPFNNPEGNWTTDIATQASFLDMPERFGPVTGISGGNSAIVFQQFGVSRFRYTGNKTVWIRETIHEEYGCTAPATIMRGGPFVFWLSYAGFCVTNGADFEIVSNGRVWDWFLDNVAVDKLDQVQGSVDWTHRCACWAFHSATAGTNRDMIILYQWEQKAWSFIRRPTTWIVESNLGGTTLEGLDAIYPSIDDMTISLDDAQWKERSRILSWFDESGYLVDGVGQPMQAVFETGDFQPKLGHRVYVSEVSPIIQNTSQNTIVQMGTRETPGSTVAYGPEVTEGPHGYCAQSADGRYMRAKTIIPSGADWDKTWGLQVEFRPSGRG